MHMKKFLRFSLLSMLLMLGNSMMAQTTVTIDFDNDYQTLFPTLAGVSSSDSQDGDFTATTTSTAVEGVTVTVSVADEGKTANRIWSGAPRLRMYSGTFTVQGTDITKIEFTGHSTNFNLSTETGTLDGKTWTGKADVIAFAVAKNTQINKMVVTLGGEPGEVTPDDPKTDLELSTCADVIAGEDGTTFRVKGVCTSILNTTYGNWDLTDETGTIRIYGTLDANGQTKNFLSLGIEEGDTVTVEGPKTTYNTTVELVDVTVVNIAKKQGEVPQVELITVAKALDIIDALENGKTTAEVYQVKGFVVSISEISTQYGNATFILADNADAQTGLTVFRAKGLNNESITDEQLFKVGDVVIVEGKLQKYVKNDVVTPELSSGYIVSIGESTAVEAIQAPVASDAIYTLSGQRVVKAQKGIFIQNGRKVVVK